MAWSTCCVILCCGNATHLQVKRRKILHQLASTPSDYATFAHPSASTYDPHNAATETCAVKIAGQAPHHSQHMKFKLRHASMPRLARDARVAARM
eukprot:3266959-Pleurochrysis_carterae.AAC.3